MGKIAFITGPSGCGKSHVGNMLVQNGLRFIEGDNLFKQIAKELGTDRPWYLNETWEHLAQSHDISEPISRFLSNENVPGIDRFVLSGCICIVPKVRQAIENAARSCLTIAVVHTIGVDEPSLPTPR